jgi:hypothetical protein
MSAASVHIDVNDAVLNEAVFPALPRGLLDLGAVRLQVGMSNLRAQVRGPENTLLTDIAVHDCEAERLLNWKPELGWAPITHDDKGHSEVLCDCDESVWHKTHVQAAKSNLWETLV